MSENLTILTSTSFNKAQIINTRLESEGIECYLRNIQPSQLPQGAVIKIFVKEVDLEKAFSILKEFHTEIDSSIAHVHTEVAFSELFIIPIDFTNASLNACYYALELANILKARIMLIHTYGLPDIRPMSIDDTNLYQGTLALQVAQVKEEAERKLSEFLHQLGKYIKSRSLIEIPISTQLIQGFPDEITLYTVESENANLIIMGVAGKEVRTFETMGKIASKIVERTKIPVIIIPEDTEFHGIDKIKNILYTTAFDESDFSAIQKLVSFVSRLEINIFCLHIDNKESNPWDKVKMDGLHEYFYKVYGKTNVECDLIVSDNLLYALDEFISVKHIDFMSITNRKRKLISKLINPDITLKILYHTRIPLLILPG
jgi:nucleotide-binding universal stress UspA family protein